MKLMIKKIYCNTCQRMVTGREQKTNGSSKIVCARCGKELWVTDGLVWHSTAKPE